MTKHWGGCLRAALVAVVCLQVQAHAAGTLRIASLNLRWYGNNGSSKPSPEKRDATIRAFLADELRRSDVIVFQEIVDVARLKREIIGDRMTCHSYQHPDKNHQHVVVCHKNEYELVRESGDNNFAAEEVAEQAADPDRARPALSGLLRLRTGKKVAHVIGVHLKAFPDESETRIRQARVIGERIADFDDDLPVMVIGDFNTYSSEDNPFSKDDDVLITQAFDRGGASLRQVPNRFKYTYRTKKHSGKFDRLWVSQGVRDSEMQVSAPCTLDADPESTAQVEKYNTQVSDHCLVATTLRLP